MSFHNSFCHYHLCKHHICCEMVSNLQNFPVMPMNLTIMQLTTYLSLAYNKYQRTIKYLNKYLVNICTLNFKTFCFSIDYQFDEDDKGFICFLSASGLCESTISYKIQ